MKTKLVTILFLSSLLSFAQATKWTFEKSHCKITFSVAHFGISSTEGKFKKFDGVLTTTKKDFSDAKINLTIDAGSVDTDDEQRDGHLKSPDFFDTANYPTISFVSKSFKPVGKSKTKYQLIGDLTIHGVTKTVILEAVYGGTIEKDPYGNTKAGFKFTGKINRKDFGLVWNKTLDSGGLAVGNEVTIVCNIELLKS